MNEPSGQERVIGDEAPTMPVRGGAPAIVPGGGPLEKAGRGDATTMVTVGVKIVALDEELTHVEEAADQVIGVPGRSTADVATGAAISAVNGAAPVPRPRPKPRSDVTQCAPAVVVVLDPERFPLHRNVTRRPGSTRVRSVVHEWRRTLLCVRWPRRL
ncbi:MAG: hypothetical protein ACKOYO_06910 [Actinomycetota bacterium]